MRLIMVTAALLLVLTGCDYRGAQSLPLPGGAGRGGYTVSMVFDDVTNLVPRETCRTADVVVGSIESIDLRHDLRVRVVCRIDPDVTIAGNARAVLRETSLLGERYVALDPPTGQPPRGRLEPGGRVASGTHVVPDVEVVFGALSQVLNGGGLANIETISREVSTALGGSDLRGTTRELGHVVGLLDDNRDAIVAALESLDRLSAQLSRQQDVIGSALDSVPTGLAVLDRQRPKLVLALQRLNRLSETAVPLIRSSRADTVADLQHLAPVLEQLATEKRELARAVERVASFPFPSYSKYVTKGDYAGMFGTITLDVDSLNKLIAAKTGQESPNGARPTPGLSDSPLPALPGLPLPGLDLSGPDGGLRLPDAGSIPGPLAQPPSSPEPVGAVREATPPRTLADLLTGGAS